MADEEAAEANRKQPHPMTPRPLYRWKSFWLGLLVMAFLGWAWSLSYSHLSYVNYARMAVMQREGHVAVGYRGRSAIDQSGHMRMSRDHYVEQIMPPPFFLRGEGKPPSSGTYFVERITFKEEAKWAFAFSPLDSWNIYLPHWLMVMLVAVPWVSFLGWRWRRQRRLTEFMA